MDQSGEPALMAEKRPSPSAVKPMPRDATIRGSMRSDSLPASGDTSAMTTGWAMSTTPAWRGEYPLRYCR